MIFSISLEDEQLIGMNNFLSLETILSEFYEKNKSDAPQKKVNEYFSWIIKNEKKSEENIIHLSNLSSISIIRLYQNVLNYSQNTIKIVELTQEFLSRAFLPQVLKTKYFTSVELVQIMCFILPDEYQISFLNIFESNFVTGSVKWLLKGVLCIRGSLSITITKNTVKKKWILDLKYSKNNKTQEFNDLPSALCAMSDKGFLPISFFYFADTIEVPSKELDPQTLNYVQLMNPQHQLIRKFKSKSIPKDKFRELVIENGKEIGLLEKAQSKEKGIFVENPGYLNAETKIVNNPPPIEDVKKKAQVYEEIDVNIKDKFSYNAENFHEIEFSVDLRPNKIQGPSLVKTFKEYDTFDTATSLSLIDKVETNFIYSDWSCPSCNFNNQNNFNNTCQYCKNIKYCYECNVCYYSHDMSCSSCHCDLK